MEKIEQGGSEDLDITSLHSQPEPEDTVQSTEDAVEAMRKASKLSLPTQPLLSGASTAKALNQPVAGRRVERVPTKDSVPATSELPAKPASEKVKTPEAQKAEMLTDYFEEVETGTDFLQKIIDMPRSKVLREVFDISELEALSGSLYEEVLRFFVYFESVKDQRTAEELADIGNNFIRTKEIPSGCHSALRAIIHRDVVKKLSQASSAPAEEKAVSGTASDEVAEEHPASEAPAGKTESRLHAFLRKKREGK